MGPLSRPRATEPVICVYIGHCSGLGPDGSRDGVYRVHRFDGAHRFDRVRSHVVAESPGGAETLDTGSDV
jgi:hypothetical protein